MVDDYIKQKLAEKKPDCHRVHKPNFNFCMNLFIEYIRRFAEKMHKHLERMNPL